MGYSSHSIMNTLDLKTVKQCRAEIAKLDKQYKLTKSIDLLTDELNDMVNKLLALEDRIELLERDPTGTAPPKEPRVPRSLIGPRRIQSPNGIYNSLEEAAENLGVQKRSIIGYISNKRPGWYYIED